LLTVENMGREALDEMRRLLGVLRRSDDDLALAPPLTLSSIDQLIDDVRGTGLAVESRVEGDQRPLAPGLEVSAYRIVQEALTNTIKHAEASAAEVVLRYTDSALELTVSDDGRGSRGGAASGHGLIGMQERAQLFNGTVTAGSGEHSGWVVTARLSTLEDS
jgi:signal transduction histidine kinase